MKKLQQLKWALLVLFVLVTIQSCQKDDVFVEEPSVTGTTGGDTTSDGGDTVDNNSNDNSDTNDTGSGDTETDEGEITLYTVQGATLIKQKDL